MKSDVEVGGEWWQRPLGLGMLHWVVYSQHCRHRRIICTVLEPEAVGVSCYYCTHSVIPSSSANPATGAKPATSPRTACIHGVASPPSSLQTSARCTREPGQHRKGIPFSTSNHAETSLTSSLHRQASIIRQHARFVPMSSFAVGRNRKHREAGQPGWVGTERNHLVELCGFHVQALVKHVHRARGNALLKRKGQEPGRPCKLHHILQPSPGLLRWWSAPRQSQVGRGVCSS